MQTRGAIEVMRAMKKLPKCKVSLVLVTARLLCVGQRISARFMCFKFYEIVYMFIVRPIVIVI